MPARDDSDIEGLFDDYMKGRSRKGKRSSATDAPSGPVPGIVGTVRHKDEIVGRRPERKREPVERTPTEEKEPIWKRLEGRVGSASRGSEKVSYGEPRLCPVCSTPLGERNRMRHCTECGEVSCEMCEDYERKHLASHIHYRYKFEFPLCMRCYERNYTIQKELGKAMACFGSGNYSGAEGHIRTARKLDGGSKYSEMTDHLEKKIAEARKSSKERVDLRKRE